VDLEGCLSDEEEDGKGDEGYGPKAAYPVHCFCDFNLNKISEIFFPKKDKNK